MLEELRKINLKNHHLSHRPDEPIIAAVGLSMRYESGLALDNVSFRLQTGEQVAVVGPNGAGKTTLLSIIAGVLSPSAGQVNVYGHAPRGHTCIAYVPQRSQVDWDFPVTVADVVMMGRVGRLGLFRRPRAKDREYVLECLAMVDMVELAGRQISELSGGQQQRMFIARALAQQAALILMDEPLSGLDVNSQEDIFRILDTLRRRNVTVVVAIHDLTVAAERFDRVMLLNGRLLGFGRAAEVLTTERMLVAYGGHIHFISDANGESTLVVADTCCDGEAEHGHG